jgi:hypothetical protein
MVLAQKERMEEVDVQGDDSSSSSSSKISTAFSVTWASVVEIWRR